MRRLPTWAPPEMLLVMVIACLGWAAGAAMAGSGLERIRQQVAQLAMATVPIPEVLHARCGKDVLCAGQMLAAALGQRASVERKAHPDTDSIRLVRVLPTVCAVQRLTGDAIYLRLDRFGLKGVGELRQALSWALDVGEEAAGRDVLQAPALVLDLRHNGGGSLKRMLRVAALFTGQVKRAIRLQTARKERWLDVPLPAWRIRAAARIDVLVGPHTASSAELFAALLRRHAGARLLGGRTLGKNWLLTPVALTHDWRLLVPSAIVNVPGEELHGGLQPDAPLPAAIAAELARLPRLSPDAGADGC